MAASATAALVRVRRAPSNAKQAAVTTSPCPVVGGGMAQPGESDENVSEASTKAADRCVTARPVTPYKSASDGPKLARSV